MVRTKQADKSPLKRSRDRRKEILPYQTIPLMQRLAQTYAPIIANSMKINELRAMRQSVADAALKPSDALRNMFRKHSRPSDVLKAFIAHQEGKGIKRHEIPTAALETVARIATENTQKALAKFKKSMPKAHSGAELARIEEARTMFTNAVAKSNVQAEISAIQRAEAAELAMAEDLAEAMEVERSNYQMEFLNEFGVPHYGNNMGLPKDLGKIIATGMHAVEAAFDPQLVVPPKTVAALTKVVADAADKKPARSTHRRLLKNGKLTPYTKKRFTVKRPKAKIWKSVRRDVDSYMKKRKQKGRR